MRFKMSRGILYIIRFIIYIYKVYVYYEEQEKKNDDGTKTRALKLL